MSFQDDIFLENNINEPMQWDSFDIVYADDSRKNSNCSLNSEKEFDQQSEGLLSTAEKSDDDTEEEYIRSNKSASLDDNDSTSSNSDNICDNISDNNDSVFMDYIDDGEIFQEENVDYNNVDRKMLYEGCNITKEESELLIFSYATRFGLSDAAFQSLIHLIDCHLPRREHRSLYLLMKKLPKPSNIITHFFCSACKNIINFVGATQAMCSCGMICKMNDLKQQQCFFIQIPIKDQLIRLLQNDRIHNMLQEGFTSSQISDVHSGKVYNKLIHNNVISEKDLTLQWNTDGVQIFQSSKVSLWPIQIAVNNLPYKHRKENIILCGLWYGSKPEMNTFLKPFIEELSILHNEGLEYVIPGSKNKRNVKVHTLIASVDSQARPLLQKVKTFRGKQGCPFCLKEGEECEVGHGTARIYCGDIENLRTHEQHVQYVNIVMKTGKVKNGIKGASVLLLLPLFNIISSFVPDYMHCVLLGVVKSMVDKWKK